MDYATEYDDYAYDRYPYEAYKALVEWVVEKVEAKPTISIYSKLKSISENDPDADNGIWQILGDNATFLVSDYEEAQERGWGLDDWKPNLIDNIRYVDEHYTDAETIADFREGTIWSYSTNEVAARELDAMARTLFDMTFAEMLEMGIELAGDTIQEPTYKTITFQYGCFCAPADAAEAEGALDGAEEIDYAKLPDGTVIAAVACSQQWTAEHSRAFALAEDDARKFAERDVVIDTMPGGRGSDNFELVYYEDQEPSFGSRYWSIDDVKDIAIAVYDGYELLDFGRPSDRRTTTGGDLFFVYHCMGD